MSEDSLPKFLRISTKFVRIMLDDESSAEKSVDDKFYDVLNSSFASSSVEHLMDRVSKMSPPGNMPSAIVRLRVYAKLKYFLNYSDSNDSRDIYHDFYKIANINQNGKH